MPQTFTPAKRRSSREGPEMILYRGTKPTAFNGADGLFRTEGMLARVIDGGDPTRVQDIGIAQAVQEHVQGVGKSSFLSFTSSHDVAMRYAWNKLSGEPVRIAPNAYGERAILFVLDGEGAIPEADRSILRLEYPCDYRLARPNSPMEGSGSAAKVSCRLCGGRANRRPHILQLIDVAAYLRAHPDLVRDSAAIDRAERDMEWLAHSTDFIPDLRGFEYRIPVSRIWTPKTELYH